MAESHLNKVQAKAAILLADGKLTDIQIITQLGIAERTLNNWKLIPEFTARIAEEVEKFRVAVMTTGIADKVNRVRRLDDTRNGLLQIIEARKQDSPSDMIGGESGLIVRLEKPSKFGTVIEDRVDVGLLAELRALEQQAAQELGQWVQKIAPTTPSGEESYAGVTDAELERRIAELEAREAAKAATSQ